MTFKYDGSDKFEQNNTSRSLVRLIKSSTFGLGLSKINGTHILYSCPVSLPTSPFHILFFPLQVLTTSMANPC